MMTIHELAGISGVSVRTLHYYDRIDLLKPCCIGQNGYRKYNGDSLLRLQQILFYKEMDLPLKKIREIMNQPLFDQKAAIRDQKDFLTAKRNRLTKLIELMEQILEGSKTMDFKAFEHNELEEVFKSRIARLDADYQQMLKDQYGSMDAFIGMMMKDEAKIRESAAKHYGSVEKYIEILKQEPLPKEGTGKLQLKLDGIFRQIAARKDGDVSTPEIQKLVGEWKETFGALTEKADISEAFQRIYRGYMNSGEVIKIMDERFGAGACVFVGRAMAYSDTRRQTDVNN